MGGCGVPEGCQWLRFFFFCSGYANGGGFGRGSNGMGDITVVDADG